MVNNTGQKGIKQHTNNRNQRFFFFFFFNVDKCMPSVFSVHVLLPKWASILYQLTFWCNTVRAISRLLTFSEHCAGCKGAALHFCSVCKPQSLKEWHLSNRTSVGAEAGFFFFVFLTYVSLQEHKITKPHLQPPTQFVFFIFSLQRSSAQITQVTRIGLGRVW